ncbi:MAG: exonuclease [candidate division Zixibacteria bacterium HGW-Zixibacteria-1]|nr:MAG: exonuclease [candidate division Zixibacteria bacterium HGW-Zixibacteria-1]
MLIPGVKNKLLIVDLEATCWENKGLFKEMETIEIGAVLADLNDRDSVREYDVFIRPVRNSILSDFCKNLTSIRQEDVDQAETFPVVFPKFLEWAGDPDEYTFASWSGYDKWQFQNDCAFHKMEYPFPTHFDIKKFFSKAHQNRKFGLSRAVRKSGLEFAGTHHRGIDDARNIWRVLRKIIDENEQLELF